MLLMKKRLRSSVLLGISLLTSVLTLYGKKGEKDGEQICPKFDGLVGLSRSRKREKTIFIFLRALCHTRETSKLSKNVHFKTQFSSF